MIRKLLTDGDPSPVAMVRRASKSRVLLTCEHAGRAVPLRLGKLGVQPADLRKHIAWDIGAWRLARCLSRLMGSTLVGQRYSRLVIDCNRPGYANDLIPTVSDGTRVPGNEGLKPGDVAARMLEIYQPYHRAIAAALDERTRPALQPALVAVHSFTPVLGGVSRAWDVGLLFNRDSRLAMELDGALRGAEPDLKIGHNVPYTVTDDGDFTIPFHGVRRGIPSVLIEIRNDHLAGKAPIARWADVLARALLQAASKFGLS